MHIAHIWFLVVCLSLTQAQPGFDPKRDTFPIGNSRISDLYDERIHLPIEEEFLRHYKRFKTRKALKSRVIGALELPFVETKAKKIHKIQTTLQPKFYSTKVSSGNSRSLQTVKKLTKIIKIMRKYRSQTQIPTTIIQIEEERNKNKTETRRFAENMNSAANIDRDQRRDADTAATGDLSVEASLEIEEDEVKVEDSYAYVALIDILFTDGCKRACTGAIIHDNVVITAAQCFTMVSDPFMQPELSMSFVVVGSRTMFYNGYEQYLPIERVVTHPRFKGWTANLALVYTFAKMNSEKPGQIISLVSTRAATQVDTNVTVLSWGQCKIEKVKSRFKKKNRIDRRGNKVQVRYKFKWNRAENRRTASKYLATTVKSRYLAEADQSSESEFSEEENEKLLKKHEVHFNQSKSSDILNSENKLKHKKAENGATSQEKIEGTAEIMASEEQNKQGEDSLTIPKNNSDEEQTGEKKLISTSIYRRNLDKDDDYVHYNHWRRDLTGSKKINLTVGTFGYVNLAGCKKVIERSLPPMYEIQNTNEALCYSSEDYYITKEDSGAPVIQNNELIAVTVGGVDSEGEHIAVGIKISCFCSWIADNLPNNAGAKLVCCKECCENKDIPKRNLLRHNLPRYNLHPKVLSVDSHTQRILHRFVNVRASDKSIEDENQDEAAESPVNNDDAADIQIDEADTQAAEADAQTDGADVQADEADAQTDAANLLTTTQNPDSGQRELTELTAFYDIL